MLRSRFLDLSHQSLDPSLFLILKGVDDPQKMTRPCNWVGGSHPGYVEEVRETGKVRRRHQSLPARSDSTFQLVISIVREMGKLSDPSHNLQFLFSAAILRLDRDFEV